jgi:uncharacterized protein (TIGR02246 family)
MARGPPDYFSYLLRLWRVRAHGPPHWQQPLWRASLQSPQTGERVSFRTLDDLCSFLREQTGLGPDPGGDLTEKPGNHHFQRLGRGPSHRTRRQRTVTKSTKIQDAIAAANEAFMAAFNGGDAAGVAALYTEEGQLLPPNADVMAGKEAIQAFWQGAMDMGIGSAQLEIVEVEGHGDTAIEVSRYTLCGADGQELDQGKYIVIWKREGGQWKLHRDIFNSSVPAS